MDAATSAAHNLAEVILDEGGLFGSDRIALRCDDRTWTYGTLSSQSQAAAEALQRANVQRGDRVCIAMANAPEYIAWYLGAAARGAILTTMNVEFSDAEVAHIIERSRPRAVVVDDTGASRIGIGALEREGISVIHGRNALAEKDGRGQIRPLTRSIDAGGDDPVLISYTSGSTAAPKPVMTTHAMEIWAAKSFRSIWRLNANDIVLNPLPLAWAYGLNTVCLSTLAAGGTVVLLTRFRPDVAAAVIAEHTVTAFFGVTAMYVMLTEYAESHSVNLRSLRMSACGGERRNEQVLQKFQGLSGVPVHDVYATSEARPIFAFDPALNRTWPTGSCGQLVPGVEAQVRDDAGVPLPSGTPGELWVRSPGTFAGYFEDDELTATRRDDEGWVRMGDVLRQDSDGFWFVEGRVADFIIRAGANISPAEVEAVLSRRPELGEPVVVGVPHDRYGEEVVAAIASERDEAELLSIIVTVCAGSLADFKCPTRVVALPAFPRGVTGKVDRQAVRRLVAERTQAESRANGLTAPAETQGEQS